MDSRNPSTASAPDFWASSLILDITVATDWSIIALYWFSSPPMVQFFRLEETSWTIDFERQHDAVTHPRNSYSLPGKVSTVRIGMAVFCIFSPVRFFMVYFFLLKKKKKSANMERTPARLTRRRGRKPRFLKVL